MIEIRAAERNLRQRWVEHLAPGAVEEHRVLRSALAGLIAVGLISGGVISGQSDTDCAEVYKNYSEELKRKEISPERRAALHRQALRIYNACETGDLGDAKGLFERLDKRNY